MRDKVVAAALFLAMLSSAVAEAKNCKCACPCAPTHRRSHAAAAAHKLASATAKESQSQRVASLPIAGGKSFEKAVPIDFEKIYKIKHTLKKGTKDHFSLPLEPGTEITLAMKSLKKEPVALSLQDPKRAAVATLSLEGAVNEVKRTTWKPLKKGLYDIAIGSDEADIPANQIIFEATLGLSPLECAVNDPEPHPIAFDEPHDDCFWQEGMKDTYLFQGKKKEVYRLEISSSEPNLNLEAKVGLVRKKKEPKILEHVSGSGGKVTLESVTLPEKGSYTVEVGTDQNSEDVLPYTVTLTRISGGK